jgi:hypothetical protein
VVVGVCAVWDTLADPAGWPGGDLLSRALRRSTMGAEAFHGRVREGIGCSSLAMATGSPSRIIERMRSTDAGEEMVISGASVVCECVADECCVR